MGLETESGEIELRSAEKEGYNIIVLYLGSETREDMPELQRGGGFPDAVIQATEEIIKSKIVIK